MPVVHQYPIYGRVRPGTGRYTMAGFGYGAYSGGFGQVTPTNAAIAVPARARLAQALHHQALAADAAAVADLTTGRRRAGMIQMRTAAALQGRARRLGANEWAKLQRQAMAQARTTGITRAALAGYGR